MSTLFCESYYHSVSSEIAGYARRPVRPIVQTLHTAAALRPPLGPRRYALGALAVPVARRKLRALIWCARARPYGPHWPAGFAASPLSGRIRAPGAAWLRPLRRLRPRPRLARPRPSLGGRVPPRLAPAGARGAAACPRSGGALRRPRPAGAWGGLCCGRAPFGRAPSAPPFPLRPCGPLRGPPSGPAPPGRLRATRLPSLLPPQGRPRGGGAQRSRALLAACAARASFPRRGAVFPAARWWSVKSGRGSGPAGPGVVQEVAPQPGYAGGLQGQGLLFMSAATL